MKKILNLEALKLATQIALHDNQNKGVYIIHTTADKVSESYKEDLKIAYDFFDKEIYELLGVEDE